MNYNTPDITKRCVKSIIDNIGFQLYELIVVDNCSSNDNKEKLKSTLSVFPQIKLVESDCNRGFGGGNMLGANCAKGDYICFINSDVKLIEDCVIPLCDFLEKHPKVGCITPQQLTMQYQKKASFDHGPSIKKEILGKNFLETIDPNKYPKRKNCVYKNPISVVHVFGALMIFPTNLFQSVGGFDANLFLYYEEYDICTRLKLRGYKSVFLPRY